jgi:hypothetical protein
MDSAEAQAHGTSNHHGADEGGGEKPEGATADLNGPEAHGHHDKKMIKPSQRMKETRPSYSHHILRVELGGVGCCGNYGSEKTYEQQEGKMAFHATEPAEEKR